MSENGNKEILTSSEAKILLYIASNPGQTSNEIKKNLNSTKKDVEQSLIKLVNMKLTNYQEEKKNIVSMTKKRYSSTILGVCSFHADTLLNYLKEASKEEDYELVNQWYFHNCIEPNNRIFQKVISLYNRFNDDSSKKTYLNEIASAAHFLAYDWEYSIQNTGNTTSYCEQHSITEEELIRDLATAIIIAYLHPFMETEQEITELKNIFSLIREEAQPVIERYETPLRERLEALEKLKCD